MARRILIVLAGTIAVLGIGWLLGMRNKQSVVVRTQRRVNRAVLNPRQLASAGKPGAYASVVRHTGRSSGHLYETPVGAVRTEDGFVVALVYGSDADWVKNVLASGSASIVHEGSELAVDQPEVVPLERVADAFSAADRRNMRVFGVRECLRVSAAGERPEAAG